MILAKILGWLTGDVIGRLTDAYIKSKDSAVESERIKADIIKKEIDAVIEARAAALQVRLSTSGFWEMRLITFLIAGCFTLHLVAVTLDTVFAFGLKIAAYPKPFDEWEGTILLSFFGIYTVSSGVKSIAGAIGSRRG